MDGRTLDNGRYVVRGVIGRGGMGEVLLARDTRLDRDVAIKALHAHRVGDRESIARFEREAKALARVNHPSVIRVFDRFAGDDGAQFIVLEYIDGESLEDLLAREGRLEWPRVARIGIQVCGALEAAHLAGVIHRDVKPSNVVLDAAGDAHVTDFGVARLADGGVSSTNMVLGTPSYIAPEVASGRMASEAADQYGLAATLFEAYCGHPPYADDGGPATAMLIKHVREPVPDPAAHRPEVSRAVRDLLRTGMAKAPEDRFASVARMRAALAASAPGAGGASDGSTMVLPGADATQPMEGDDATRVMGGDEATRVLPPPLPSAARRPAGPDRDATNVMPPVAPPRRDAAPPPVPARRVWPRVLGTLAAIAVVVAAAVAALVWWDRASEDGRSTTPTTPTAPATTAPAPAPAPAPVTETFDTTPQPPVTVTATTTVPAPAPPPTAPTVPTTSTTPTDAAAAHALVDEATAAIDSGDYDTAIDKAQEALVVLEGSGDPYEANALYDLGYAMYLKGDCEGSIPYLERAAGHAEGTPDQKDEREATLQRAYACVGG